MSGIECTPRAWPDPLAEALEHLTDLDDAGQLVAHLHAGGYRGRRNSSTECPISRYLAPLLPGYEVMVERTYVWAVTPAGAWQQRKLPPQIRRWVQLFNDGWYPELEDDTPGTVPGVQAER